VYVVGADRLGCNNVSYSCFQSFIINTKTDTSDTTKYQQSLIDI